MRPGIVVGMEPIDLTNRVVALEEEMVVVHREVAEARELAAGADQDVADYRAELRGHTRVLNALRETQLEQGQVLAQHGQVLAQHGQVLAQHGQALAQHGQAITVLIERVDQLDGRVDQLTGTVNFIRDQHGARLNDIVGMLDQLIDRGSGQN